MKQRVIGLISGLAGLVALASCTTDVDDGGEDLGEAQQAIVTPCASVALLTPANNQAGTSGVPMTLSATGSCPGTPEFQYWVKLSTVGTWTIVSGFVPGSFSYAFPTTGTFNVTAVVRNVGTTGYDKRANSRNVVIGSAPPSNFAPTANADTANVSHVAASQVTIDPRVNDTDPDSDTLIVTAVTQGTHGSVGFTANSVTYTAAGGFVGGDSFNYTIDDGHGHTASAAVAVTLTNVNPDAIGDSASIHSGATATGNVVTNDSDPDADAFTVTSFTQPANGSSSVAADGSYSYTSASSFTGSDSFTYTITDAFGGTATATVTMTVTNTAPVAVDDTFAARPNQTITGTLFTNDSDADSDSFTVTANSAATSGSVSVAADGSFSYTAGSGTGSATFTYTIKDPAQGSSTATVTVNVTNGAPTANNDSLTVAQNGSSGGNVLTNDTDPDSDTLVVTSSTAAGHGTASVGADGTYTYSPTHGYSGSDSFTYSISDGFGGTSTGTVNVTVTALSAGCTISLAGSPTATYGQQFTLTATASCNTGTAEVRWFRRLGSGANTQIQGYATTQTLDQVPNVLGAQTFTAEVRTVGTTSPTALSNAVVVTVADNVPVCTAAAMVSPAQSSVQPAGGQVMLTGSATCPQGATPEFQYWFKSASTSTWTILNPSFVPGAQSWNVPVTTGLYDLTVVVRSQGSHGGYQARSNSRRVSVAAQ